MAEKSTRTKMLEEAEIKDDPLMLKRAMRGVGVGISKAADKMGFTQEEEYKKMKKSEVEKKRSGGTVNENKMMKRRGRNMTKATMQKEATKAVRKHEKAMHGMKSGGSVSKRADGIAQRGKTNCKMV